MLQAPGYNVTLAVGYKPMLSPIGVRVEAAYNEFGAEDGFEKLNVPAFTGNLVYALPGVSFSPYIIGGAGLYTPNIALGRRQREQVRVQRRRRNQAPTQLQLRDVRRSPVQQSIHR